MSTNTASGSQSVLLSLASRQVWPHILAVAHLKPSRLILLHSEDTDESKRPAARLQKFFDQRSRLIRRKPDMELVPHDNFNDVERRLDELAERLNLVTSNCVLNFTGGNKLMATAAFRWAAANGVKSFYLERGNRLTWFEPAGGGLATRTETLDGHIADSLDPLALLRCQLLASEVEREGEKLVLSKLGEGLSEDDFHKRVRNGGSRELVEVAQGFANREMNEGDHLELAVAAVLLKLGVPEVRRSLRLKVNTSRGGTSSLPHAEIDLLFNWSGKLWLVDCKDRIAEEDLMNRLRGALPPHISDNAKGLLGRIGGELKVSQTKVLKEDLIAINDIGGLLGQVVCVRKNPLPDEVRAYADRNRIEVVLKDQVFESFRRLLNPKRPASQVQLVELERRFAESSDQRTR